MGYNWIKDRALALRAIKNIINILIEKYGFNYIYNDDSLSNQFSQSVEGNNITLTISVSRSAPYEIFFKNENQSINMMGIFLYHNQYDIGKLKKFLKEHFQRNESQFKNKEEYFTCCLQDDILFIEENYPKIFQEGEIDKFIKSR